MHYVSTYPIRINLSDTYQLIRYVSTNALRIN